MITAIDGETVDTSDDLGNAIATKQPGDSVEIELYRDGEQETVEVELGERPSALQEQAEAAAAAGGGRRRRPSASLISGCRARLRPLAGDDPREDLWDHRPGGRPPGR